ncbi:MAG: FkbM family methyltransferase [Bacteroidia bacterium]|jgi:FkbM family methyltransferase|nr:FkbM family methyltransferase [Bacteroidia bacterium]
MSKLIRAALLKWLGYERYLQLVSAVYIQLIKAGFYKQRYAELFYLKQLVKPGFQVVDIGANVGYYSVFLSLLTGESGRVYAVEPVELFAKVFTKNINKFALDNVTLFQTALGDKQGKLLMGTPIVNGVFRHGLTHILDDTESREGMHVYEVPVQVPDQLFNQLSKIDFIKCDVEGYEVVLMPLFVETINKHKPILQIEISGSDNRTKIFNLMSSIGYEYHILNEQGLRKLSFEQALDSTKDDFYFMPLK